MQVGTALALAMLAYAPAVQRVEFDPATVMWALKSGNNSVEGEAFLRTRGGDVKTCAGFKVYLIPDSPYARSRMTLLYGSDTSGYLGSQRSFAQLAAPDPDFVRGQFKTTCDAAGRFSFAGLPSGRYYIQTVVSWSVPARSWGGRYEAQAQGGEIMQRVDLAGDDADHVILTF